MSVLNFMYDFYFIHYKAYETRDEPLLKKIPHTGETESLNQEKKLMGYLFFSSLD